MKLFYLLLPGIVLISFIVIFACSLGLPPSNLTTTMQIFSVIGILLSLIIIYIHVVEVITVIRHEKRRKKM